MSAEERKKVGELSSVSGSAPDEALHALRECNGDVEAAANRLLEESAWRTRAAARARVAAAGELAALCTRASRRSRRRR